jgi:hypothetical protein
MSPDSATAAIAPGDVPAPVAGAASVSPARSRGSGDVAGRVSAVAAAPSVVWSGAGAGARPTDVPAIDRVARVALARPRSSGDGVGADAVPDAGMAVSVFGASYVAPSDVERASDADGAGTADAGTVADAGAAVDAGGGVDAGAAADAGGGADAASTAKKSPAEDATGANAGVRSGTRGREGATRIPLIASPGRRGRARDRSSGG